MQDMLSVLKPANPISRLGEGYRKKANSAPRKRLGNL